MVTPRGSFTVAQLEAFVTKSEYLNGALMYFAIIKQDEISEWALWYLRIEFLGKDDLSASLAKYDYGNVIFIKKKLSSKDALKIIDDLSLGQQITVEEYTILGKLRSMDIQRTDLESYYPYGYLMSKWPVIYLSNDIGWPPVQTNYNLLARPGLPLFSDMDTAMVHLFNLNIGSGLYHPIERRVEILLPDYRCRIEKITIANKQITISIETKKISEMDIVAKIYCRYSDRSSFYDKTDFKIENGKVSIEISGAVTLVDVAVISKNSGEILDYRRFGMPYWHDYNGTVITEGNLGLEAIISKGESQTTEFKVILDHNDSDDFLETVVAFANTNEGIILIGVDNKAQIIGVKEDFNQMLRTVDNWIGDRCEPKPRYKVSKVTIRDKDIVLINVEEGDKNSKPFCWDKHKIYLRANSTDRPITRAEIDEIYKAKQPAGSPFRLIESK